MMKIVGYGIDAMDLVTFTTGDYIELTNPIFGYTHKTYFVGLTNNFDYMKKFIEYFEVNCVKCDKDTKMNYMDLVNIFNLYDIFMDLNTNGIFKHLMDSYEDLWKEQDFDKIDAIIRYTYILRYMWLTVKEAGVHIFHYKELAYFLWEMLQSVNPNTLSISDLTSANTVINVIFDIERSIVHNDPADEMSFKDLVDKYIVL